MAISCIRRAERNRISGELHNSIGHTISAAIVQVNALQYITVQDEVKTNLNMLQRSLETGLTEIRNCLHYLHNDSFDFQTGSVINHSRHRLVSIILFFYTTLEQTAPDTLRLVYKKAFLQAYEWGRKDIGVEITLSAKDGRPFKQKYHFKIKANTLPPTPNFTVAKTTGSPSYYVLCITVPDMDKQVQNGLLHNDLVRIDVNGTSYPFSVNTAEKRFEKPASDVFITQSNVKKLGEPNADELPSGGWVLYYKTDAEVKDGAVKKDYAITLADEKGLVSGVLKASTKPNRPAPVQISLVKGICTADVNNDNTGTAPHTIVVGGEHKPATLRLTSATANATISYTLTETSAGSSASLSTGSDAGSGLDISLPIQTGKTEAEYILTARADAEGFELGTTRTVYYKIIAQNTDTALSELKLTEGSVNYSASLIADSDSAYICKIPFTEGARNLTLTATTANSRATITAITVNGTIPAGFAAAHTVTLTHAVTLPNSLPAQAAVKITVTGEDPSVTKEYTLIVTYPPVLTSLTFSSGGTAVSLRNTEDTANESFNSRTLEYYIFADTAQLSSNSMSFAYTPETDAIVTVKVNGTEYMGTTVVLPAVGGETIVTLIATKAGLQNEYKVHIKRKSYTVTFKAEDSDDGTINVTTGAGIGSVTGKNSAAVTVKAEIGARISATATAASGCTFTQWSKDGMPISTASSLSYEVESNTEIKAEFKSPNIYVRGTNSDWYSANVLGGADEGNDITGTGSKRKPYKTVSKALTQCTDSSTAYTIFADGTIEESTTLDIPSSKTVTIESLRKDTPAVIHDNRPAPGANRYLITTEGTLTFDSVILKANITETHGGNSVYVYGVQQTAGAVTVKGEKTEMKNFGHAVKVKGGTFTMENGSICNNYVNGESSGVAIEGGGTFIFKGGTIKDNEATNMAGVYVKGTDATRQGQLTMIAGEISGNKASCNGGGIYVGEYGKADISGGAITANHAAGKKYFGGSKDVGGGGIYIEKGTVNFTGDTIKENYIGEAEKNCGAGVLIGEQGTFNMSGGTIKDCTTERPLPDEFGNPVSSEPSRGSGVYVAGGTSATKGTFNMTGGRIENCKPRSGHTAQGGGVYVGAGAVFTMEQDARITPSTGSDANVKGNNDAYLANAAKITIAKKLESQLVARITPESYPTVSEPNILVIQNPAGNTTNVAENYFKFTVTRDSNTNTAYCVNEEGRIRKQVDTTPGDVGFQNWGKLKAAIENASNGDVIYIRNNCQALNNSDTITVDNKTITLIGLTVNQVNLNGNRKCRIFKITNGGNFTIKNVTLEGGDAQNDGGNGGGGILLASGGSKLLTLENVTISACYNSNNGLGHGVGIAIYDGTVTMKDKATISGCETLVYNRFGGGVYIGSGGVLNIDGSAGSTYETEPNISSCKAYKGGGVYIALGGQLNLIKGYIAKNSVKSSPKKGYAVYNENTTSNSFNWSGGTIKYHYVGSGGTVIEGPCNNSSGNTAD